MGNAPLEIPIGLPISITTLARLQYEFNSTRVHDSIHNMLFIMT